MNPTIVPVLFRARDQMSSTLARMQGNTSRFARTTAEQFRNAGQSALNVGKKAAVAAAIFATPLVLMVKSAVDFEEKMSDVGKTTGMQGVELRRFGDQMLAMSTKTRTSIDDLATIAEVGGQLGVSRKEMIKFTAAANQFSIALGADFSGGVEEAVSSISKMKTLFKDTRGLDISQAITRSGSAINELGAVGNGTSANITDFGLRMGALPDALKDTATNTLALGAYMEEMGIDSQIAAGGMSNLLLVAGQNLPKFAKQMGISSVAAKELLAQNPSQFASDFSKSFKGMAPDKLAAKLQDLKIGSQETIKVVGALSSDQIDMATGMTRLATLQGISNKAFAENNSLKSEAAKKEATAAAQMAKLKNNVKAMSITLGNALLPMLNELVQAITPMIQSAANWIKNNRQLAGTILKVVAGAAALSGGISMISFAVGGLQKGLVIAKVAMKAFAMVGVGPIALLAAGIAAVVLVVTAAKDAWNKLNVAASVNADVTQRAFDKTVDQRAEMQILFNTLRRTKTGTDEYRNALTKIEEMQPGITKKYNLQAGALNNISRAEKDLTRNIMARAEAEARAELLKESIKKEMQMKTEGPSMWNQFMGAVSGTGGLGAQVSNQADIREQQNRSAILGDQVAEDQRKAAVAANPEQAAVAALENFKQIININVDPTTGAVTVGEKNTGSGITGGLMPKLNTTR